MQQDACRWQTLLRRAKCAVCSLARSSYVRDSTGTPPSRRATIGAGIRCLGMGMTLAAHAETMLWLAALARAAGLRLDDRYWFDVGVAALVGHERGVTGRT